MGTKTKKLPKNTPKTGSVTTNIMFSGQAMSFLRALAFTKGCSVAEIIRRSLKATLPGYPEESMSWGRRTPPELNGKVALTKGLRAGARAAKQMEKQILADLKSGPKSSSKNAPPTRTKRKYTKRSADHWGADAVTDEPKPSRKAKIKPQIVPVVAGPAPRGRKPKAKTVEVVKQKRAYIKRNPAVWGKAAVIAAKKTAKPAPKAPSKPAKPAKPAKRAYTKRSPKWSTPPSVPTEPTIPTEVTSQIMTAAEIAAAQPVADEQQVVAHDPVAPAAPAPSAEVEVVSHQVVNQEGAATVVPEAPAPAAAPVAVEGGQEPETLVLPPEAT